MPVLRWINSRKVLNSRMSIATSEASSVGIVKAVLLLANKRATLFQSGVRYRLFWGRPRDSALINLRHGQLDIAEQLFQVQRHCETFAGLKHTIDEACIDRGAKIRSVAYG